MKSFKNPSFQDRAGQAAAAKKQALDQLRTRPQPDEKILEERRAANLRREMAKAQKAEAKRAAAEASANAAVAIEPAAPVPTEAERKAARDARYAARKNRR